MKGHPQRGPEYPCPECGWEGEYMELQCIAGRVLAECGACYAEFEIVSTTVDRPST